MVVIGFIASLATVFDDIIAYLPFFTDATASISVASGIGIIAATVLEITLVIFFSEKIAKIKYKEEIAAGGLLILAVMIICNII